MDHDNIANKAGWILLGLFLGSMTIMLIAQWIMLTQRCMNGGC